MRQRPKPNPIPKPSTPSKLSVALTLSLFLVVSVFAFSAAAAAIVPDGSDDVQADAQQEKKKKKQRGKTVKATVVPYEPATDDEAEAAEGSDVAEPTAAEKKAAKKQAEAERKAEREAMRAEEKEAKARERAESRQAAAEADQARREEAAEPTEARANESSRRSTSSASSTSTSSPSTSSRPARSTTAEPTATAAPARPAPEPRNRAAADPPRRTRTAPPTRPRDVVRDEVVVREVLLDVLVNDKDGNPIKGLGPSDFVVTEGGVAREVTSVTYYGGEEFSGSGREGDTRTDRYFILMFHDLKQANPGLTASQLDAGRWATRWLEDGMLPNDQVAVVGYDVRLKLYQDFTRDREEIANAILAASRGGKDQDRWKSRSDPEFDPDSPSLFVNMPTGKALSKQTRKMQEALELIGNAAEGIAGRKNLVLFSLGFGETRGSFGNYVPDPRYYPPMEQALNNGNVAVYTINTLGATRGGNTITGITDSLNSISRDTGGFYYSNFINVKTPLKQVAEDNQGYYLISYRSEYGLGEAGYQEVEVEANAPGAKVRARKGYRYGEAPVDE